MTKKSISVLLMLALAAPITVGCSDDTDDGGGDATGGDATGGTPDKGTGGDATGGMSTGGDATGGMSTGGDATGGMSTGGDATGGTTTEACDLSRGSKDIVELTGDLDTQTLSSDKVYQLKEYVYVPDGETLTIEPCTRIEGLAAGSGLPGTLIVSRGGMLMAEGEADKPILFTTASEVGSRDVGQWGGVIVLGKAPSFKGADVLIEGLEDGDQNKYGGDVADDNSGSLKYLRIEFGGSILGTDNEINGLTLGGVGSKTTLSHIMVNTTKDDCFEFFGGTVDADHLICNNQGDDMFDVDEGFKGELTYLLGVALSDSSSNPNGFEMDSDKATTDEPRTFVTVKHATLCGIGEVGANTTYGMVLRENLTGDFDDIAITGFDYAADARDGFGTPADPSVVLANANFFGMTEGMFATETGDTDNDMGFSEQEWFDMGDNNVETDPAPYSVSDCLDENGPNDKVTGSDIGAFNGDADWATGMWVDWAID